MVTLCKRLSKRVLSPNCHDTFLLRGKVEGVWDGDLPSPQGTVDDYAEVNEGIRGLPFTATTEMG